MTKEDCKYWDKCYQTNEHHLNKYNHPDKPQNSSTDNGNADKSPIDSEKRKLQECKSNTDSYDERTEGTEIDTSKLRAEVLEKASSENYFQNLNKRIKLSEQAEYDQLLSTNDFIRHKFLVEMPPDFYDFWRFISDLKPNAQGEEALVHLEKTFQLQLVGPFEFLAGRFKNANIREPGDYLCHWRFFYDPPEFQTIFVRSNTGIHYGYWRDLPKDKDQLLIARNDQKTNCVFDFIAGNIFDAFLHFLENDFSSTPFTASAVQSVKKKMHKFITENKIETTKLEDLKKKRLSKTVAKTFHKAGIIVPCDSATKVGYRRLAVSDAELKKICEMFGKLRTEFDEEKTKTVVMEKLQPIVTAASIAMDECDFGTTLELGIDLFCSGRSELHALTLSLLVQAYSLLDRPQFIAIAKAHMERRRSDLNLSIFELNKET